MSYLIDDLYWHDGNLSDFSLALDAAANTSITLNLSLYSDGQARQRSPYRLRCERVKRFNCTLDLEELRKNLSFGHIANGYLKQGSLWLYFSDGLLEICAAKFELSKLPEN